MPTRTAIAASYTPIKLPADATYAADVAPGARGARARLVQEWLGLHGIKVKTDGEYGPATVAAVRTFQQRKGLPVNGTADRATFEALVAPMAAALRRIEPAPGDTLGRLVVRYAEQHLAQHPQEVGGANRGPWVRLYMDGHEGDAWAWCAGFATFVLGQAASTLGVTPPVVRTFSCDELAGSANKGQCFVQGARPKSARDVTPGSFFLVRKSSTDWTHVGIVSGVHGDAVSTIEGNTNDAGDREGYEVCARVRPFGKLDFVLIP